MGVLDPFIERVRDVARDVREQHQRFENETAQARTTVTNNAGQVIEEVAKYDERTVQIMRESLAKDLREIAEQQVARIWREAVARRDAVIAEAPERDSGPDYDETKVEALTRRYVSTIRIQADRNGGRGTYVEQLYQGAKEQSPEHVRALIDAAMPLLAEGDFAKGPGTSETKARHLLHEFARFNEEQLAPQGIADPESYADAEYDRLKKAILDVEGDVTGVRPGVFRPLTPWSKAILGESVDQFIVVSEDNRTTFGG